MKKVFKYIFYTIFTILFFLFITESYYYFTRTDDKSKSDAIVRFKDECIKRNVDPNSYDGPIIKKLQGSSLEYQWKSKINNSKIFVLVAYFPHETESWFLEN